MYFLLTMAITVWALSTLPMWVSMKFNNETKVFSILSGFNQENSHQHNKFIPMTWDESLTTLEKCLPTTRDLHVAVVVAYFER